MKLLARPRSPATEPTTMKVSGRAGSRRAQIANSHRATLTKLTLMISAAQRHVGERALLLAQNAVGDQDLVGKSMPLDETAEDRIAISLAGQIEHFDGRRAAARGEIGGIGLQVIAVAADQQKHGAALGGEPRIGLRDRRGAAENPDIARRRGIHCVTRRQKSDMILGSRNDSNRGHSG